MADKPIIFSAPMVKALIEGRKHQTRRVLKPQPHGTLVSASRDKWMSEEPSEATGGMRQVDPWRPLRYAPGDRLYVREAWRTVAAYDDLAPSQMGGDEPLRYEADNAVEMWGWARITTFSRYRHARHMPRWASRLTPTVTDVRVQRLQEISEEDARAEGIKEVSPARFDYHDHAEIRFTNARAAFADLWNSLHGPDAWAANPWVVALTFTVERRNIDEARDA